MVPIQECQREQVRQRECLRPRGAPLLIAGDIPGPRNSTGEEDRRVAVFPVPVMLALALDFRWSLSLQDHSNKEEEDRRGQ